MVLFLLAMALTPGPNNTVLMTLAAAYGPRSTIPHLVGIVIGISVMFGALAAGLGALFVAYPVAYQVLKWVGFAYILWMAWGILRTTSPNGDDATGIPTGWVRSTIFQVANPKAWIVLGAYVTAFVPTSAGVWPVALSGLIFFAATLPISVVWIGAGHVIGRLLTTPKSRRIFTTIMALALVGSMVPVLFL
jgi:threonine/homoserine/homoserine lactone efflux protein